MGLFGRLFGPNGESISYEDIEPGMVFKVRGADHVKVVKVESAGVHVVDVGSSEPIDLGGMQVSMGGMHMPWSRETWESNRPRHVRTDPVEPRELEGYEVWRADGGGWF